MVCYCCVKGCSNNSNIKKKNPSNNISFHAFPSNKELRIKWLRAIGRPNWDPPSHSRICSIHFNYEQINHDSCRTRIKDDACPVNALPPNSNFEATYLEVCRICLAIDVKMYNLENGRLRDCLEAVAGLNDNYNIEGLPQFVCYECAAYLIKCYSLIERAITAQAILLDIFAQNGHITKSLIRNKNREELNLKSTLKYHSAIPTHFFEYKYVDENETVYMGNKKNVTDCLSSENIKEIGIDNVPGNHLKNKISIDQYIFNFKMIESQLVETVSNEVVSQDITNDNDIKNNDDFNDHDAGNKSDSDIIENTSTNVAALNKDSIDTKDECGSKAINLLNYEIHESSERQQNSKKKRCKRKSFDGLTPDEIDMQEYFNIVKLTSQEQMKEWRKTVENRPCKNDMVYKCEICSKLFSHLSTYNIHVIRHDPSRGKAECPVCKLRFKNEVVVKSHANRTHGKKFYCKSCPKVFNNVAVAKKHHKWHCGHQYSCPRCPFRSAHASSLGAHSRSVHAHAHACTCCGRAATSARSLRLHRAVAHPTLQENEDNANYQCESCNLSFSSEGARRVHILTSKQHRQKNYILIPTTQDPSLKTTCKRCGVELPTIAALTDHTRTEHRKVAKKTSWSLPDDSYPTQCEYCEESLGSRSEHWRHVRRVHAPHAAAYRRVITAVCDTCGKGFQSTTKLRLHQLRHGRPLLRCESCARRFYDKYALARHAATHARARPHACRCGRAFKLRAHLLRHYKVHTGATPYNCPMCDKKFKYSTSVNLHVRTVHYKLPHPPRKKRANKSTINIDDNND